MRTMQMLGLLDWMNTKIGETQNTVVGGMGLLAMVYIGHVWWTTKHVIKTAVAFVLAGAVLFAITNTTWFKDQFEKETVMAPLVEVYNAPTV